MKKLLLISFLFAFIFFSCSKDKEDSAPDPAPAPAPVACFSVDTIESILDSIESIFDSSHVFVFSNCSQNAVRYEWDFGDLYYAPVPNPSHIYNQQGIYNVYLTAYNADNVSNTISKTLTLGHYTLDKIVYRQTSTRFITPFILRMLRTGYFDEQSTLPAQSFLPMTVQLTDSSIYDFDSFQVQYYYREDSLPFAVGKVFNVYLSSIIDNQFDTALGFVFWDTAKFTMYYKFTPR